MEFPTLVYKDGGPHQRPGGTYDYKRITNQTGLADALASGWAESLVEAMYPAPATDDNESPTREELEAKATELGIKFDGRTSDKSLLAKIQSALEKP